MIQDKYSFPSCNAVQFGLEKVPRNLHPSSSGFRRSQQKQPSLLLTSAGFLHGLLLNSDDGGNMFLWNVRLFQSYTILQLRRLYSSVAAMRISNITIQDFQEEFKLHFYSTWKFKRLVNKLTNSHSTSVTSFNHSFLLTEYVSPWS
jgi:hypothetical protein